MHVYLFLQYFVASKGTHEILGGIVGWPTSRFATSITTEVVNVLSCFQLVTVHELLVQKIAVRPTLALEIEASELEADGDTNKTCEEQTILYIVLTVM